MQPKKITLRDGADIQIDLDHGITFRVNDAYRNDAAFTLTVDEARMIGRILDAAAELQP